MKISLRILFVVICFSSCSNNNNEVDTLVAEKSHFVNDSKLTFIDIKSKKPDYAEIYFYHDSLLIHSEEGGYFGPYHYRILNDTIYFNKLKFNILRNEKYKTISLVNNHQNILLYDIPLQKVKSKADINPFYLRRCHYLVALNIITMREALNFLNDSNMLPKSLFIEDEIIDIH